MNIKHNYFDIDVENLLNTSQMKELQWKKMQQALQYFYEKVPFERNRFEQAGILPEDIRSMDDLANMIPYVTQADFRVVMHEGDLDLCKSYNHIFGSERFEDLYLLTTTSGTTGIPTPYPIFRKGVERVSDIFGRIGRRAGMRAGDRMAICFGLSMHAAGTCQLVWYKNVEGLTIIPIGAEAGTDRILNYLKLFKATTFTGTPSLALHLIERAPEVLGQSVKSLGIRTLICGAEPGAGVPEVRARLESEYGAKVIDIGAGYGVSCDHPVYQGMHWVADDYCYFELVDPETKKPIPMVNGATGLAVFTPLEPEAAHFFFTMRFTLNDIVQVFTDPCPCGRSGFRYKVVGRADDMLKVKGVPVYPAAIQGVIHGFLPQLTGSFRIVLDSPPPLVVPPLKLKVEYGRDMDVKDLGSLELEIMEVMHKTLKIRPKIEWLKPNTLERASKKTQLIESNY